MEMRATPLSLSEWDIERGDVDFHVRLEEDDYFVDAFDSHIQNSDVAHLATFRCLEWDAVAAFVCDFNPKLKRPETGYGRRNNHTLAAIDND